MSYNRLTRLETIEFYSKAEKLVKSVRHFKGLTLVEFNNGNRYDSFLNKISEIEVSDDEDNNNSSDIERQITIQNFKTNPNKY